MKILVKTKKLSKIMDSYFFFYNIVSLVYQSEVTKLMKIRTWNLRF